MIHLLVFALQATLTLLVGRVAARILGPWFSQPADDLHTGPVLRWAEGLAIPFTIGCAVLSLLFAVAGHLRLDAVTLTALAALLAAPAVPGAIAALRAGGGWFPVRALRSLNLLERAVAVGIAVMVVLGIGGALTPEVRHDPLFYHVQVPQLWLNWGRMVEVPENGHSYFPYGFEMLFTWSLALGSDSAAKLFHLAAGLVGAVWCARLAALLRVGATAPAGLFLFLPTMCYLMTTTYIDLATAMYGLGAVAVVAERWGSPWCARRAIALGLLTGSAMATKYTAWPLLGVPLGLAAACAMARQVPLLLLCGVAALTPLAPWVARNVAYVGNPVAPLMIGVFGPESARDTGLAGSFDAFAGGGGLIALITAPWNYAQHLLMQKYVLSLLGMVAGAAALLWSGAGPWASGARRRAALLVALCAALYLAEALATRGHPDGRYGLASQGLGAVLVSLLCARMGAAAGRACVMAPLLALAMFAAALGDWSKHQRQLGERWVPVLSHDARRSYMAQRGVAGPDFSAIEEFLRTDAPGRIIGHGYPSRHRYWSAIQPMRNDLAAALPPGGPPTPDAIAAALKRIGVTHIAGDQHFVGIDGPHWEAFLTARPPDLHLGATPIRRVAVPVPR